MSKKSFARLGTAFALIFLALFLVLVSQIPFVKFREGSFLYSVVGYVYSFFANYLGFFRISNLQYYTLLPICAVLIGAAVLVLFNAHILSFVSLALFTVGAYIILGCLQGRQYFIYLAKAPYWIIFAGFALVLASFVWLVFRIVVLCKGEKKPSKVNFNFPFLNRKNNDSEVKEKLSEKELKFREDVKNMKHERAIEVLANLTLPTFKAYQNKGFDLEPVLPPKEEVPEPGKLVIESCTDSEIIEDAEVGKAFKRKAERKIQNVEFAFTEEISELVPEEEPESEESFNTQEERKPVFGKVRVREKVEEEGPAFDEDISDEELDKSKSSSDKLDMVSGVGGLKKAANGDYYYNPKKFEYKFPPETCLKHYPVSVPESADIDSDEDGKIIVDTFAQFKVDTKLVEIQRGPTFTLYELVLAKGIKVNTVQTFADNIAMELAVQSVRILAPIPGKSAIGIEVPNRKRDTIGFDEMMVELKGKSKKLRVPMILGKTITGERIVVDLASAPHMLIAGTTGSGKSVCVNSLICSVLFTKSPKEVRMLLVDPKMVELTVYNDIPHLLTPVITEPKRAIKAMAYVVEEMQRRMTMFSRLGARKIEDYNQKIVEKNLPCEKLPYIMVIVDEFADLMMVVGKELEAYIKRITAVARFTGIHLVLATQRPSADVITGIIKSNMPTQIAFAVSNAINSRIILDTLGAEKLLGRGDMLYASASNRIPQRIQGAYIDSEIEEIVNFVKTQGEPDYIDESYFEDPDDDEDSSCEENSHNDNSDDMLTRAWKIVSERGEASASYIQRRLSIGYNRAANLIEQMEDLGYVGPMRGSKPREILKYPDSGPKGDVNDI